MICENLALDLIGVEAGFRCAAFGSDRIMLKRKDKRWV
jgi:hypothetical protein